MVRAVADHHRLAAAGGWPLVPDGPSIRPGMGDPRLPAIRRRLAASGDLAADAAASTAPAADEALMAATRRFQERHGLVVDGIIGRRTVATMNITAAVRAEQLSLGYDRLRALAKRLPATGVVINIPAASLQLMENGRVVLTSRVIVGRPDWPTPELDSEIGEIEVNPYWTVPARIVRRELLPRIAADPRFLAANRMRVLNGNGGGEVGAEKVDWTRFLALGYRLRQEPGLDNPLGTVKFLFPNPYDVYLHDTPAKRLFGRAGRAFSHGCVRVNRAFDLAARLLRGDPAWTAGDLRAAIDGGRTRRVRLARPVPIRTVYLTAWAAADGAVQFRPDLYGRDAAESRPRAAPPQLAACGAGPAPTAPATAEGAE
jgi:murein L,D-transpeptidase YcbB/YkuD